MPFTLAHPAAVLPLRGWGRLRTAPLIIGAMVPDLPYFLPGNFARFVPETHEFNASYTVCLLLGLLALFGIFMLRRPLTALLSARARWLCLHALAPLARPREWFWAAVALLLGVWTHLLWDSFTHADGWVVRRVSALSAPVTIGFYTGEMCHVLQYLSSVLGLAILAVWYLRLRPPVRISGGSGAARSAVVPMLLLITAAAVLIGAVQATEHYRHFAEIYRTINILLTHSLAWFAMLYVLAGSLVTLERKGEAPR